MQHEAQISVRHHFVPAFLLSGFTDSGKRNGTLYETDFTTGEQIPRKAKKAGSEEHFHTVDVENVRPDFFEREIIGGIEDRCAPTIKEVIANRAMPTGRAYEDLMFFVALMMTRTPKARKATQNGVDQLEKHLLKQLVRTEAIWNSYVAQMRADGVPVETTHEEMKQSLEANRFHFEVTNQSWLLHTMFTGAEAVVPFLVHRTWSVLYSEEGEFICSDHPATCRFTRQVPAMWSPAPGLPHTDVQLPVSRHIALFGSQNGPILNKTLNRQQAAFVNSRTLLGRGRFVYSTDKDFIWLETHGQIETGPAKILRPVRNED